MAAAARSGGCDCTFRAPPFVSALVQLRCGRIAIFHRAERANGSPETRIHPPLLAFITLRGGDIPLSRNGEPHCASRRCSGGVSPSLQWRGRHCYIGFAPRRCTSFCTNPGRGRPCGCLRTLRIRLRRICPPKQSFFGAWAARPVESLHPACRIRLASTASPCPSKHIQTS